MNKRISVLALMAALPLLAREDYTRNFDKTVTIASGAPVRLEHKLGDITMHSHADQSVVIHAEIRASASDAGEARDYANHIEILIDQSSGVAIRTRYPETPHSFLGMRNISFSVHYDVTVPESAPVYIRNSFGRVEATGLKAGSDITNGNGELIFRDGRGTARLGNSFARVEVSNNQGDVSIDAGNGAVQATDISGQLSIRDRFGSITVARVGHGVTIDNSNGNVDLSDAGGNGEVKNSFGSITVRNFRGGLIVNNSNGSIDANQIAGPAELNTTFGGVTFSDIGQRLSIRAGNSHVEGSNVRGPLSVVNSFGAVTVSNIQGDLHVESGNGAVTATKVGGAADIRTSFATVNATDVAGPLTVHNSNGAVKGTGMKSADVTTSFGAVVLDRVAGAINVQNQNGGIDVASSERGACQPITLKTSFSAMRVHLPSDASYRVSAHTSFGKISSDFPLTVSGSISSDRLEGSLGGGHCEMNLSNGNGAIEILKGGM